jgi:hypothetical protein
MAGQAKAKGKKIGRNKDWCAAYRMRGTRERNKRLKLARHLRRHPNDKQAAA